MKVYTGDTIVVITGKDKGKTGKILRVLPERERVVIEGVNMRTRHVRKTPQRPGQIVRYEASIHVSNVMLLDPTSKKRTRIGFEMKNGKKTRIAKKSGTILAVSAPSKASVASQKKKETSVKTNEAQATPSKKPFWKRLGLGADALEEAEGHEESKDHSVPSEGRLQSSRSHGRGS
ncbi:50S ribosomal protein L24 [Candidatus Peregrinibacteria bacterium]|nr:50S ribosomal protein L24 [Candidatus Peregrinibacteria bacterium]